MRTVLRATGLRRAPFGAWDRIQARIEGGDVVLLADVEPAEDAAEAHPVRGRWVVAAVVLLVVAVALSAAIPGSPLRRWLEGNTPVRDTTTPDEPAAVPSGDSVVEAGVLQTTLIVAAIDGSVSIEIERADPALDLRVRTTDASQTEVRVSGMAATARFRSGPGRLTIAQPGAGAILLLLPRGVERITLRVDGTPYLVKDGERLRVLAPLADTAGSEIILRVPP